MGERDIRFTEKKIDSSWKEKTEHDRGPRTPKSDSEGEKSHAPSPNPDAQGTSRPFLNLITSLGVQALIHLGDLPHPETKTQDANLEAAKEVIDLIMALKKKTEGRRSPEEDDLLQSLLPELQMKYANQA